MDVIPRAYGSGGWTDGLTALFVVGHGLTALASAALPFMLMRIRARVPEVIRHGTKFDRMALLFSAFIAACGTGHLLGIIGLWRPWYVLEGWWHVGTGLVSLATVWATSRIYGSVGDLITRKALSLRYPYDILFDDLSVGVAVVSAGVEDGDRIWSWRGENRRGRFLRVNPAFRSMTGYSSEWLIEHTYQDITTAETLQQDLRLRWRVDRGEIDTYDIEKGYRRRDGSVLLVSLSVRGVRDDDGNVLYYMSKIVDLTDIETERRRNRERVQQLEAALSGGDGAVSRLLEAWSSESSE